MVDPFPRLSPKQAEILRLLVSQGEMYGLELVAASPELKAGTIYVTLARMEDRGLVVSRTEKVEGQKGLPRRLVTATGYGARVYAAWELARLSLEGLPAE